MDIITKRARQETSIIQMVDDAFNQHGGDNVKITKLIKNKMLEQDMYNDYSWTFAKQYITEKALQHGETVSKS